MTTRFACAGAVAACFTAAAVGLSSQTTDVPQTAQRGSAVVVRGCVAGTTFAATSDDVLDPTLTMAASVAYRLTGPKALLKSLRTEHEGHWEEITGRISGAGGPSSTVHKTKFGKGAIMIGRRDAADREPGTDLPTARTLQVESFRHLDVHCPR